jgi:tetratricopeptide (TPR) repeat protein
MLSGASKTTKYTVLCVLSLFIASIIWFSTLTRKKTVDAGAIITLPVQMDLSNSPLQFPDTSVNPYALMDSIIQQLPASVQYPVLQTEDVIQILQKNSIGTVTQASWDIERLFSVSGARVIIELSIKNDSGKYQLDYVLHQEDETLEGVLVDNSLPELIASFVTFFNQTLELPMNTIISAAASEFAQPQLITALELIQEQRFDEAMPLLESLVVQDKSNLMASRALIELQLKQEKWTDAKQILTAATSAAEHQDKQGELAKLGLLSAQMKAATGNLETALLALAKAKVSAAKASDWQSLGEISLAAGRINFRLGRYYDAKTQYLSAMHYYKIIRSPYGKVLALNEIAQIEFAEHNYGKAYRYINQSLDIVTNRKLSSLEKSTFELLKKIEAKFQR